MECNVGNNDRVIRAVLGLIIIGAGLFYESLWGLVGAVLLATAALRFCPVYLPFKIKSK